MSASSARVTSVKFHKRLSLTQSLSLIHRSDHMTHIYILYHLSHIYIIYCDFFSASALRKGVQFYRVPIVCKHSANPMHKMMSFVRTYHDIIHIKTHFLISWFFSLGHIQYLCHRSQLRHSNSKQFVGKKDLSLCKQKISVDFGQTLIEHLTIYPASHI